MVKQIFGKKILSIVVALCMTVPIFSFPVAVDAATTDEQPVKASSYGLVDDLQRGQILQCWNWSYKGIKDNMKTIAEQGFSAVQTSPIQVIKESTQSKLMRGSWWVYYQPSDFKIDSSAQNALGTKADFEAMCAEAHKYGVKVIVDAVLNHMANQTGNNLSPTIPQTYRDDRSFWHDITRNSWYDSRYDITQYCMDGVPDLNTSYSRVQECAKTFLQECIDAGADGFRFDGAKHIETPADSGCGSDFWPNVLKATTSYAQSKRQITPYYYGEILDGPTGKNDKGVASTVLNSYTSLMSLTASSASNAIRGSVNSGNASGAIRSDFGYDNGGSIAPSKAVLWNESHDTYQNGGSSGVSDSKINMTWALVGTRGEACGMYLARPQNYSSDLIGKASVTAWASPEVKAINQFKNYFSNDKSEYLSASNSIAYNERGTSGVVLVNCRGGAASVSVTAHKMQPGTYKDQISGKDFTVSGGQIKGQIGSTGIAVVYNAKTEPSVEVSKASGTYRVSKDSAISVDLSLVNATEGTYQIDDGQETKFTSDTTVKLGAGVDYGVEIKLTVSATDGKTTSPPKAYTYKKADPNAAQRVYFDNKTYGWNNVYAYIYYDDGEIDPTDPTGNTNPNTGKVVKFTDNMDWGTVYAYFFAGNSPVGEGWPGTLMTDDGDNGMGHKNYKIDIPQSAEKVIFTKGKDGPQTVDITLGGYEGYWLDGSQDSQGHYNATGWNSTASVSVNKPVVVPVGTVKMNADWPGVEMTLDDSTGYYVTDVPEGMENGLVIFSDGVEGTTKRYPADEMPGMELNGNTMLFAANNSWTVYSPNPVTEPKTDPQTDPKTEPKTEPKTDPVTEPKTEPQTEPKTEPKDTYILGDADGDGEVSMIDAAYAQKHAIKQKTLTGKELLAADVDDNKTVDIADAIYIQKYVIKMQVSYNIGEKRTVS